MQEDMPQKRLQPAGKPGRRSSALWEYADEVRRLLAEGWTYPQIRAALEAGGVKVSLGWLQRWGRANVGRVRGPGAPARGTSSVPAGVPPSDRAGSAGPLATGAAGKSMEDLLAEAGAAVAKPKPKSAKAPDPIADLLKQVK